MISGEVVGLAFRVGVGAVLGYFLVKFRLIEERSLKSMTREDMREYINDRLRPMEVLHSELKEDLVRIDGKLDRLLTSHLG